MTTTITDVEQDAAAGPARQLRRLSRTLAVVFGLATILVPLLVTIGLLFTDADHVRGGLGFAWLDVKELTFERRLLLAAIVLALLLPTLFAFERLRALFLLYADGTVFAAENIACLRAAGKWLLWAGAAAILSQPILSVTASWGSPQRHLQIGLDSSTISTLLGGAVIYAIARVMDLARAIDEERAQFV